MVQHKAWREHQGRLLDSSGDYEVITCESCGFNHVIPIPSEAELDDYYQNRFFAKKPDYFARHKADEHWWRDVNQRRYRLFENLLGGSGRILDLGCGPGFFLKHGKDIGWQAVGVEPSPDAAAFARDLGLDVINRPYGELQAKEFGGLFDVVHSGWMMEHIADPRTFIKQCLQWVRPGGLFCAVVANDYNPLQTILRRQYGFQPWWLVPPEHINYFSIESLKFLLMEGGFEFCRVTTTFPMELFLLMGDNYVGDDVIGKQCHRKRVRLEQALADSSIAGFTEDLADFFAAHNMGRDIIMTVKKPLSSAGAG